MNPRYRMYPRFSASHRIAVSLAGSPATVFATVLTMTLGASVATVLAMTLGASVATAADADVAPATANGAGVRITDAEKRLFMTDHLAGVGAARVLAYRFERRGTLEPQADDSATLTIGVAEGKRTTSVDYLHDERRIELPAVSDVQGNPVLLHFLEREIRELSRLTGGSRNYYRKRIRMALAGDPPIAEVAIDRGGKSLRAYQIRIDPYLDDPARSRYEKFATRFYTMVLSPDIPGEIYQLRAELSAPSQPGGGAAPVQSEVLTYEGDR